MTIAVSKILTAITNIPFPTFQQERIYMVPFRKGDGLPAKHERWQPTVDAMLKDVPDRMHAYLMVDEKRTLHGSTSRRPGLHVDGYWDATLRAHRGGGGHTGIASHSGGGRWSGHADEAIILASNVSGCVAYEGAYMMPKEFNRGDCSSIDVSPDHLKVKYLMQNTAYVGHTMFLLHESVPVPDDCDRTVVRLNVPGWLPN